MPGRWVLLAVAVVLLGAAAGGISVLVRTYWPSAAEVETEPVADELPPPSEVSIPGTVVALNVVGVPAPVAGTLETVIPAIGEEVFEGELLAHIRNTALAAEMQTAEEDVRTAEERVRALDGEYVSLRLEASRAGADASSARETFATLEREYVRSQNLLKNGAIPRLEHEKTQAAYRASAEKYETLRDVADAADQRARNKLNELEIARKALQEAQAETEFVSKRVEAADVVSPVYGVLSGMVTRQGDEVHPDAGDLFLIALDLSRMAVVIDPNPDVRARLRPGQSARVYLAELPAGWVEGVVTIEDRRVLVEFTSPTAVLPGLTAQVTLNLT